jgi:nicotinamidase/pyrazinamidase
MKTVFFDVDTQIDFLYPAGALYAPGAEQVVPNVAALNRYAASRGRMVISTMDAHAEDDPEFKTWPHHCVVETTGQQKPVATLLDKRVVLPNRPCDVAIEGAQQILLEKQTVDCFTSMHLAGLLMKLGAERYVVYGVVTEVCVKNAAFGLLKMSKTGTRVEIVTDAVRALNEADGSRTLADFTAAGGVLTTVAQITSRG